MRFSMLFALTLVVTLSFAFDAQARGGRRKKNRDCGQTQAVAAPCCGATGYGQVGYAGGYAVNSFGVAPGPLTMPMPGVVRTDGTTTQPSTGIIQTSGTSAPMPTQQPMTTSPIAGTTGAASNDCGCQAGYGSYASDSPKRRGLFRGRR